MNWAVLAPFLVTLLQGMAQNWVSQVPPPPVTGPVVPPPVTVPAVVADQAIKDLQTLLNNVLALNPPLVVDGWLGPKTDAAIEAGIAKIKTFLPNA